MPVKLLENNDNEAACEITAIIHDYTLPPNAEQTFLSRIRPRLY